MRLTVIGCGTAVPDPERVASGYLVETASARILFDCGPGVVHGLARAHAPWARITHLALTHFHNDHIGDVPALFFALKYATRPRRTAALTWVGPPGTLEFIAALPDALGAHIRDPGFEVEVIEVEDAACVVAGDALVHVRRTRHTESSVAFRVEADGRSAGYTGDTGPDDELAAFLRGVDVLVCECSLPEAEAKPAHLTPQSAAAFASAAAPGRLILTHTYPQLDRATLPAQVAGAGWDGPVVVAHDGLTIEV